MSSRARLVTSGTVAAALFAVLAGCGGATVEGEGPEVTADRSTTAAATSTPFAEERPEKPTGPVPPPAPQSPVPEPMPGEPEPPPAPEPGPEHEGEAAPPPLIPGAGDFVGLMGNSGIVLPEGMDPVGTALEACGRFDGGQQMDEVSGWLGEQAQLDPDGQGYFLGAAVTTFCPGNFAKLG